MRLSVYVEPGCPSCKRAVALALEAEDAYPDMAVTTIDITKLKQAPANVFAVPTFVLNGQVVSLGNPSRAELARAIEAAFSGEVDYDYAHP